MIPNEWFAFKDWLKKHADNAGEGEIYNHYIFVWREWTSHIANTICEKAKE